MSSRCYEYSVEGKLTVGIQNDGNGHIILNIPAGNVGIDYQYAAEKLDANGNI